MLARPTLLLLLLLLMLMIGLCSALFTAEDMLALEFKEKIDAARAKPSVQWSRAEIECSLDYNSSKCEATRRSMAAPGAQASILLSHTCRMIYFTVPKVSSLKIRKLLRAACPDMPHMRAEMGSDADYTAKAPPRFSLSDALKHGHSGGFHYFRFAFVRDPVERFLSVYNRVNCRHPLIAWGCKEGKNGKQRSETLSPRERQAVEDNNGVQFFLKPLRSFLHALLEDDRRRFQCPRAGSEAMLAPMSYHLNFLQVPGTAPDPFDLDFIGNVARWDQDWSTVTTVLNISTPQAAAPRNRSSAGAAAAKSQADDLEWQFAVQASQLEELERNLILDLYREDKACLVGL